MRSQKHLFILTAFIVAVPFFMAGCGSDDNSTGSNDDEDRIVGTWNLVSLVVTSGGIDFEATEIDECLLETTLTFEAEGDFSSSYATNNDGECATSTATGTWEFEGESTYTIHAEGLDVGAGTQELSFSNNNNTFSFSETNVVEGLEGEATITFERQ